jgi:hypothetical protein
MNFLTETLWLAPILWMIVYTSDYFLTIACARLYKAQDKIVFEGSFEINPLYQADVNALRLVSPRFFVFLLASTGYLIIMRFLAGASGELMGFYEFVIGVMMLAEITVHLRHLRNWFLFKKAIALVQGHIEYPRGIMLRGSAFEFAVFGVVYAIFFALSSYLFFLGGVLACGALSINNYRLAKKHERIHHETD